MTVRVRNFNIYLPFFLVKWRAFWACFRWLALSRAAAPAASGAMTTAPRTARLPASGSRTICPCGSCLYLSLLSGSLSLPSLSLPPPPLPHTHTHTIRMHIRHLSLFCFLLHSLSLFLFPSFLSSLYYPPSASWGAHPTGKAEARASWLELSVEAWPWPCSIRN